MLTTTYALVAISLEQKNANSMLMKLQNKIMRSNWNNATIFDLCDLKSAFKQLIQFDKYCRSRKIEAYIIPAIRRVSIETDALLDELESLSSLGLRMIRSLYEQIQLTIKKGIVNADTFFSSMECYCQSLRKRLAKEEQELLPVAERILSFDQWFAIAVECLSDEENGQNYKLPLTIDEQDIDFMEPMRPYIEIREIGEIELLVKQNNSRYSAV